MDLGKLAKVFNKPETSPSGKYDDPINVAIGAFKPGDSVETMENLIVSALSNLMYGDSGKNKKTINDISSFAKKGNNPIDLAIAQVKALNNINSSIHVVKKELSNKINANIENNAIIAEILATGLIDIDNKLKNILEQKSEQSSKIFDLVINANNLDQVMKDLVSLTKSKDIDNLNKIFETFYFNSKNLSNISQYIENLNKSLAQLVSTSGSVNDFNESFSKFVNNIDKLSKSNIYDTISDDIEALISSINMFMDVEFDEDKIINVVLSIQNVISLLEEINATNIDNNSIENIVNIINGFSTLEKLQDIDYSVLDDLDMAIPKLNMLIDSLSTLKSTDNISFSSLQELIKNISNITIASNNEISELFGKKLITLISIMPSINELIPSLETLNLDNLDNDKLTYLKEILEVIDKFSLTNNNYIDDSLKDNIKKLNKIIPNLQDFSKKLSKAKLTANAKDIESLGIILSAFDKLKIDGNFELDKFAINEIKYALKPLSKIIEELDKQFGGKDYKTLASNSKAIIDILHNIDSWKLNNDKNVLLDSKINNLKDNISGVADIIDESKKIDINKKLVESSKYFSSILSYMDNWRLNNERATIEEQKVKDIKKVIPGLIEICEELSNGDFKEARKNTYLMIDVLDVLKTIDAEKYKNLDLAPLISVLGGISKIGKIISKFDSDSLDNIENLQLFVMYLITNEDSVINSIANNIQNIDYKKKIEDIKQITDIIYGLSKAAVAVGFIGAISFLMKPGIKALNTFVAGIKSIIEEIKQFDPKQLDKVLKIIDQFNKIIILGSICMLIGGFIVTEYPQIIVGALAFSILLRAFLVLTIEAISIGLKPLLKDNKKKDKDGNVGLAVDLNNFAKLIAIGSFIMVLGAIIVLSYPQIIIGAMGFGIALGAFLLCVTLGVSLGTRAMGKTKDALGGAAKLVLLGTFVMMLGAVVILYAPKLVIAALAFGLALGLFLLVVVKSLTLASKGLNLADKTAKQAVILIVACTFLMMLGAVFILHMPKYVLAGLLFGVTLGLFIKNVVGAINNNSKNLKQAIPGLIVTLAFVIVTGAMLIYAGKIILDQPALVLAVAAFGTMLWGFMELMTRVVKKISDNEKTILKASVGLAVIGAIVVAGAYSMKLIAEATTMAGFWNVAGGALIMLAVIKTVALIATSLGAVASQPFYWIGIAALATVGAVILMSSYAIKLIAEAMDQFSKIKKFDPSAIIGNIGSFLSIVWELKWLAIPGISLIISSAANCISKMSKAISDISETVQEVAQLTIPIYDGTKKVGYRHLKNSDFKNAANNVKSLITILGKTIIDIYNKNKDIFATNIFGMGNTPFEIVVRSTASMSKVISAIGKSVRNFADLKIPIYQGTKIIGYDKLDKTSFTTASENVQAVILTLGKALIELYNSNPEIFKDKSILGFAFGGKASNTPLGMTIGVTQKLGSLISSIAHGVQSVANLKIPTYDNQGKVIGYKKMEQKDIPAAGDAIKEIVITYAKSLISLYTAYPEMFQDSSIFKVFGGKASNTPLGMTIGVTQKLGSLISSIAHGVQAVANLRIPINWDKDGKPIKFNQMGDSEIKAAGSNIENIIKTYADTLIKLYKDNPTMFQDSSIFKVFGGKASNTPLGMTIGVTQKLGSLISSIAHGVQAVANLRIPINWDKDGKPIKFKNMNKTDIENASANIKDIISTYGESLMQSYKDHSDWYTSDGLWNKITGDDGGKSPFARVINTNMKLGSLISSLAKGISSMASLRIPEVYDKDGKAIKYVKLGKQHIELAKTNITDIITAIGGALVSLASNKMFKDDDNSPMHRVLDTSIKIGDVISKISNGIKDYAELKVPTYDADGKIIGYEQITENTFENAAKNINKIITTSIDSLTSILDNDKYKKYFSNDDETLQSVLDASVNIGEMISSISEGVINIAAMTIPEEWDKNGKPIKFRKMKSEDFDLVKTNITDILTSIPGALVEVYNKNAWMFTPVYDGESIFGKMIESSTNLGDMIESIAKGVSEVSSLESTLAKKGIKIDYNSVGTNIAKVVTTIGNALKTVYNSNTDLFTAQIITEKTGLFKSKQTQGDSIFGTMINACSSMGKMIISIAQGVSFFANIEKSFGPDFDLDKSSKNIGLIVTNIGDALIEVSNKSIFTSTDRIEKIINIVTKSANAVKSVAEMIKLIGAGKIPLTDSKGNIVKEIPLNEQTIQSSANLIKTVLTTISKSFTDVIDNDDIFKDDKKFTLFFSNIEKSITLVKDNAKSLAEIALGKIGDINISENTFEISANNIKTILETVSKGIASANESINSESLSDGTKISKDNNNLVSGMLDNIHKAISFITESAKSIEEISKNQIGNITLDPNKFALAKENINLILSTITSSINNAYQNDRVSEDTLKILKTDSDNIKKYLNEIISNFNDINTGGLFKTNPKKHAEQVINQLESFVTIINSVKKVHSSILNGLNIDVSICDAAVNQINKVIDSFSNIKLNDSDSTIGKLFGSKQDLSGIKGFVNNVDLLIKQANDIANAPIEKSYSIIQETILSLNDKLVNLTLPESFVTQTESLDKFVKSVSSINIQGVDSLTELLRELNKLGINMDNLDKLTEAISSKLSNALTEMKKSLNALNKTMIEDGRRKLKHETTVKNSVNTIKGLMNQTMKVEVKMDDGGSTGSADSSSEGDTHTSADTDTNPRNKQ